MNASTLALIDAGIAMRDYVVACSAGCIDGHCMLDLNQQEAGTQGAELTVALLPRTGKVVMAQMGSRVHLERFQPLLELAVQGCQALHPRLRTTVIDRTTAMCNSDDVAAIH